MGVRLWSDVQVLMTSAEGTPLTVTAVTKANPAVATFTGTQPAAGAIVYFRANGMTQINERAFVVGSPTATTFQLTQTDSTGYSTFTSGTATPQTMGVSMQSARNVAAAGGEADLIDVSTIHDRVRKSIPGATSAATFDFECFWDPNDSALVAMKQASDLRLQRVIRILFSDGSSVLFGGYVSCTMLPAGSGQDVVTTSVRITMFGSATILI